MKELILLLFIFILLEFSLGMTQEEDNDSFSPSYVPPTRPRSRFRRPSQPKPNIKGINILEGIFPEYPKFLANEEGMSLYVDTSAQIGATSCYDDCLKIFTPAIVRMNDSIKLNEQLDDAKVGLLKRDDGTTQVAYNSMGLFYYKNDTAAGDIYGQGLNKTWYLMSEKGEPYKTGYNATSAANATNSNVTSPASPMTGSGPSNMPYSAPSQTSQHLQVTGYASLLVVPDKYIIYFTITAKNQSYSDIISDIVSTVNVMKRFVNNLGATPLTYLGKEINFSNGTYELSQTYFTTTSDEGIVAKLSSGVDTINSQKVTVVKQIFGNTISDKLFKEVKNNLFKNAVKNSLDNAYDLLGNMNYTLNMDRPIYSLRIDPYSIQTFHPVFFRDSYSSYFLLNKNTTNVVSMKVIVDYNLKKK